MRESRFFFVSIDTLTVAISSPTVGVMPLSTPHRAIQRRLSSSETVSLGFFWRSVSVQQHRHAPIYAMRVTARLLRGVDLQPAWLG
jgi:hypothetical protein